MIAIWGGSFAAVKAMLDRGVQPLPLVAVRFWIAALCLVPLLERSRVDGRAAGAAMRTRGVLTGLALFVGYALQTFGVQATTASLGGFMTGLIVLLVAVASWVLLGEPVRKGPVTGLLLGVLGVTALSLGGGDGGGENTTRGVLLLIGSSVSYAVHVLLISRLSRRGDEVAFALWQLVTVAALTTALSPLATPSGAAFAGAGDWVNWLLMGYLAVLATSIAIVVQSRAQPQIAPSRVATLFATQPLFAALAGYLFLGERLGSWQWVGGALIVAGVLIANVRRRPVARGGTDATPSPTR